MDCCFAFSALHVDSEQKEDADQKIDILTNQDILNNPKIPKSDSWPF
jgi:phosphoribosylformylglycinamidine (FGAM) synthase PurS component